MYFGQGIEGSYVQGIEGRYVRPWSLNLLFYRRGFGLVVSVVVPSVLAVLPICERSRVRLPVWTSTLVTIVNVKIKMVKILGVYQKPLNIATHCEAFQTSIQMVPLAF
jgi:hypothetical protein